MKLTDGLFLKVASDVAKDYPQIEFNNMIVDNWYVYNVHTYNCEPFSLFQRHNYEKILIYVKLHAIGEQPLAI